MMARWRAIRALQRRTVGLPVWRAEGNMVVSYSDDGVSRLVATCRDPQTAALIVDLRSEVLYVVNLLFRVTLRGRYEANQTRRSSKAPKAPKAPKEL